MQTLININIYHQHHNSPVWKDHEIFDPERYLFILSPLFFIVFSLPLFLSSSLRLSFMYISLFNACCNRWTSADMETSLFGSYIPFILGPRNCIGSKFAMLEVRGTSPFSLLYLILSHFFSSLFSSLVLLAMIIQKLKFEPEQGQEEVGRTITNVVMVPRTPVKLLFQERL